MCEFDDTASIMALVLSRKGIACLMHGQKAILSSPANDGDTHSILIYSRAKSSTLLNTSCTADPSDCICLAGATLTVLAK